MPFNISGIRFSGEARPLRTVGLTTVISGLVNPEKISELPKIPSEERNMTGPFARTVSRWSTVKDVSKVEAISRVIGIEDTKITGCQVIGSDYLGYNPESPEEVAGALERASHNDPHGYSLLVVTLGSIAFSNKDFPPDAYVELNIGDACVFNSGLSHSIAPLTEIRRSLTLRF